MTVPWLTFDDLSAIATVSPRTGVRLQRVYGRRWQVLTRAMVRAMQAPDVALAAAVLDRWTRGTFSERDTAFMWLTAAAVWRRCGYKDQHADCMFHAARTEERARARGEWPALP